jgi:hypothetical protein
MWTIVPAELVLDGYERHAPVLQEVRRSGITMLVTPLEGGMGRVERLISPNPQDYLRPEWQPGAIVPLHG